MANMIEPCRVNGEIPNMMQKHLSNKYNRAKYSSEDMNKYLS